MNEYHKRFLNAPSLDTDGCAICKRWAPTNLHHVIPRSQGGGEVSPLIRLCGAGNGLYDENGRMLHHGMVHHHLCHLDFHDDTWWYLITEEPMKFEKALELDGWKPISPQCDADWEPPF